VGPLDIPERARIVIHQLSGYEVALDNALQEVVRRYQDDILRDAIGLFASLVGMTALFGGLCMMAFTLIHRRIGAPVRALETAVARIDNGDLDARAAVGGNDELTRFAEAFNGMLDRRLAAEREVATGRALMEAADELYVVLDRDYRHVMVNGAYARRFASRPEAMRGLSLQRVVGEAFARSQLHAPLARCLAGERMVFETRFTFDPDEGQRVLLCRCYPLESPVDGQRLVAAVITDVTELRAAQTSLLEQDHLLRIAGRVARLGGWRVDVDADRIQWSDVVAEIHGMPPGHSPPVEEGISYYAPEWRDRIHTLFSACVSEARPYDEELEIVTAQGERVWVRTVAEPVIEAGRVVAVQGAFQDISGRKETEAKVDALADSLATTLARQRVLIDSLPAHIALLDSDGFIVEVNEQWRRYGARRGMQGDVCGPGTNYLTVCDAAIGPQAEEAAQVARSLREVLAGGEASAGFTREYASHGPGEQRWFRLMVAPLTSARTADGASRHGAVVMHVDVTERKLAEAELRRLVREDRLTGLLSRYGFGEALENRLADGNWPSGAAVVVLDVESLRDVNDVFGDRAGDELLVQIAARLRDLAGADALTGRSGAGEFIVFLPEVPAGDPPAESWRLEAVFVQPFRLQHTAVEVSGSFGFTRLGTRPRDAKTLIREAALALNECRAATGGDPWCGYSREIERQIRGRITLAQELREALRKSQFELYFQPKVDLASGRLVAGEALLRWVHPRLGLLAPGAFIPVAERSQLIVPIGEWALREACRLLREWQDEGLDIVRLAVNVSSVQLMVGEFSDRVREALARYDVPAGALSLEITETVFGRHSRDMQEQIDALRDMGVRVCLDDFGTGYSSLGYLQSFRFDEIKIDRSFVGAMLDDSYSSSIVATVLDIARALDAAVVAEGIETAAQRDRLLHMGCTCGQGFFYSPPVPASRFRALLEQRRPLPIAHGGT
jgi:diguanylate cyclase (GGDEF)-like protein/PAS domain S-box-containing protein